MSLPVYRINTLLSHLLRKVRVGTNLDLFLLLWTLLSGRLLESRGALFPALSAFGLPDDAVRRAEAALNTGRFAVADLVEAFGETVAEEGRFEASCHGGYRPVAADLTAFFRPCLKGCPTKHYHAPAGKALPAIRLGVVAKVGSVGTQRLAVPVALVRADARDPSETAHRKCLLDAAKTRLAPDEVLVLDRGFPLSEVIAAGIERFVVRLPGNFTARRATPPVYKGVGRPPRKGAVVRPLSRRYGEREIEATPPDRVEAWTEREGAVTYELRAEVWEVLLLKETMNANAETTPPDPVRFQVVAVYDPRFTHPLLLATRQPLSGADARRLYLDQWPVEGVPQAAKVAVGAHRQFVFGAESRQRLPEVALLAGAVLSYLAATEPAHASGFWDRNPKPTAGRLRRVLSRVHYANLGVIPTELRRKDSPTGHLPKGVQAHRRRKQTVEEAEPLPKAA